MNTLIKLVQEAHKNQKYGDMPYIVHLMLVQRHFIDKDRKIVALLHDILEDTDTSIDTLRGMFNDDIVDAVIAISRLDENENYLTEYIPRCSQNEIAKDVKIADLEENIYSAENNYPEYSSMLTRYKSAHWFLTHITPWSKE